MWIKVILLLNILMNLFDITSEANMSKIKTAVQKMDEITQLNPKETERVKTFLKSITHLSKEATRLKDAKRYCRSFLTCDECINSMWFPCTWCHNTGCTHTAEKYCTINTNKADKYNFTSNITGCPYIHNNGPVLVPAGVNINLKVKAFIPDPVIYKKRIICLVQIKKRFTHLIGMLVGDTVYCYSKILKPDINLKFTDAETGTLRLIWGGAEPYSNEIPLVVYKCGDLALDCDTCRLIPTEYGCGWCDKIQSCVVGQHCAHDLISWTLNRLTCDSYVKNYFMSEDVDFDVY